MNNPPVKADFKLFTVIWNQTQSQTTPALHVKMAGWLEESHEHQRTNLLLMAFRSAGKSTMVGLYAAWLLYQNPCFRILVLAADHALAKKMVRNVKRIIERHPCTKHLKPKDKDQWAAERFTITRDTELRDPSMLAKGITANITGLRADIVICDDVEVPNTCDSPQKRQDLRERLAEIPYILVAGGKTLYVGTPHDYYSIYADTPRTEIGEEQIFLQGYERLEIPLLCAAGQSAWPDRYTSQVIDEFITSHGRNKFDSQMQLKPVNIAKARLDPDLVQYYNAEIAFDDIVTRALYIGDQKMISASAWWDPSLAKANGDDSVLAIIFTGADNMLYLHHLEYIKTDPGIDLDEATHQCRIVGNILKQYRIPYVLVETNGIGNFLPAILRKALAGMKGLTKVRGQSSTSNKSARIIEAFDMALATRRLKVHERIKKTPFLMEMREWQPNKSGCKDDALDAVAGALLAEPFRIEIGKQAGGYNWKQTATPIKGDWDV